MSHDWRIVEYPGREGLLQLESEWKRLVLAMPDRAPQHTYETHLAYFNQLRDPGEQFTCLVLTNGSEVRAICPLESGLETILGRRTRVWGLLPNLHDLQRDVICPRDGAERELFPRVVQFLANQTGRPTWLLFDRVLAGSAVWRCLQTLHTGACCTVVTNASDVLDCQTSFEEHSASMPRKHRRNLRNAHRRLSGLADVRFERATDPVSLMLAFQEFLAVEASGWKGNDGAASAVVAKPGLFAFFTDLMTRHGPIGQCEIDTLRVEGHCIASLFCLRAGSELALLKIGYDELYSWFAPGQLLLENTFERCCAEPEIERLSLVSHTEWARVWRPRSVPVYRVYIAPDRWSAGPLVALLRLRLAYGPRVKRWIRRVGSLQLLRVWSRKR